MKKTLFILLALVFAIQAAACATGGSGNSNSSTVGGDNTVDSSSDTASDPYAHLPEKNYNGTKFKIGMESGSQFEFYIEEDSSDPIDSALYKRNAAVESKYGIVITPVYSAAGDSLYAHTDEILKNVMGESNAYDLISAKVVASGGLVINGILYDWSSFDTNDLDGSWWIKSINDEFVIDDHIYTAVGQSNISAFRWTYAMMFNRTQADNRGLTEQIFEAIDNGDWTIDYFNSIVSGIYEDIDDVNGRTMGDFYGFNAEALTNLDVFQFAFDIPMIAKDDDTTLKLVFGTEKTADAISKVNYLYWTNPGSCISKDTAGVEGTNFIEGRSIFAIMTLDTCFTGLREMNDHYAILPFPKYDADQKDYLTGMMDNYNIMGIPTDALDAEMSSIIAEALNIEAEKTIYPVWKDESLSKKFVRDDYTVKYLDIVLAGRNADMGTLFQQDLGRISMMFRDCVRAESTTFISSWDSNKESLNASLQTIIEKYRENASTN